MTAVKRDTQLRPSFRMSEFRCRCRRPDCDAPAMDSCFMDKLQRVRDLWGRPIIITSGARCEVWNAKVGGKPKSFHKLGKAADIKIDSFEEGQHLAAVAERAGMGGIEIGNGFIHLDDGPKDRHWTYS